MPLIRSFVLFVLFMFNIQCHYYIVNLNGYFVRTKYPFIPCG